MTTQPKCLGLKATATLLASSKAADRKKGQASLDAYKGNKRSWDRLRTAVAEGDTASIKLMAEKGLAAGVHVIAERKRETAAAKAAEAKPKTTRKTKPKASAKTPEFKSTRAPQPAISPDTAALVKAMRDAGLSQEQIGEAVAAFLTA